LGSLSIWHWLVLLILVAATAAPFSFILRKAGLNPWLSLIFGIPLVGYVALWIFALARWPAREA
jgi:hypothetical protein